MHLVVQHLLFVAAGFLLSYGIDLLFLIGSRYSRGLSRLYSWLLRENAFLNRRGIAGFTAAALLTVYWHIPRNFDGAVLEESVHIQMHLTYIVIGALIFVGSKLLTRRMRHFALVVAGKAMGIFGAFLLFTRSYVYKAYPAGEQPEAGLAMVLMMLVMDLVIVPYWLYNYFSKPPPSSVVY